MKILRAINNNIVSARDEDGAEVIATGKGIGFKAREGAEIDPARVQRVYRMHTQNETDRLKELFANLPEAYIRLTDDIFGFAKRMLNKRLYEGAYITLADHLHFAVQRHREGLGFQNILAGEVRRFYPQEYAIGKHALDLIEQRLAVRLPADEAASIAMHLLNAEYDISVSDTFAATTLLDGMVELLEHRGVRLPEADYYAERFVTHLRYLAQRVAKKQVLPGGDDGFYQMMRDQYPGEVACAEALAAHIEKNGRFTLSKEEIADLAVHIRRVRADEPEQDTEYNREQEPRHV